MTIARIKLYTRQMDSPALILSFRLGNYGFAIGFYTRGNIGLLKRRFIAREDGPGYHMAIWRLGLTFGKNPND